MAVFTTYFIEKHFCVKYEIKFRYNKNEKLSKVVHKPKNPTEKLITLFDFTKIV